MKFSKDEMREQIGNMQEDVYEKNRKIWWIFKVCFKGLWYMYVFELVWFKELELIMMEKRYIFFI